MFGKVTLSEWENLVKKQLKTENIYEILNKENLEDLVVKPYYDSLDNPLKKLPKVEESTHLVAEYHEDLEQDVFAFALHNPISGLKEKTIFYTEQNITDHLTFEEGNQYFSLIDTFNDLGEHSDSFQYTFSKELYDQFLELPFKRSICIDISRHQNAGASIVQQLSIALAKTKELVEVYGSEILQKLIFKLAIGSNYFFEMAKVRALKLVINQLSKEYGLDNIPYLFAETTLRNKAKNDEENNLIRSTLELASAMIGGADAVFTNDFKIDYQTELSKEISFKQQIVLAYESIINVFEDGANGSYYVEDLTKQIAEKSWAHFLKIEDNGGYLESLNKGILQKEIYNHAIAEQQWVKEGKIKLIGVNLYPKLEKTKTIEELYSQRQIKPVRWAEMFE